MTPHAIRPTARRNLLRLFLVAPSLTALVFAGRARAQAKLSKTDARYQDTPKGDQQCSECTRFQPPTSCNVVAGEISPRGWCALYEEAPE